MIKTCWIDVETTGLSAYKQDIIQIAGIIDINGVAKETFEFKCQPYSWDTIEPKSLEIHGYSVEDLRTFPDPREAKANLIDVFSRYVDRFNKKDKFIFAGYNVPFDYGFVREWFKKSGDTYFGSWFEYKQVDIYPLFYTYAMGLKLPLPDHTLITAAKHFGIEINAHDALSDITATRCICLEIQKLILNGVLHAPQPEE